MGKWSVQVQNHRPVEGRNICSLIELNYPSDYGHESIMNLILCVLSIYISTSPHFQAISQYLPRGDLRLRPAIYEMILHEFLKTDYEVFCFDILWQIQS